MDPITPSLPVSTYTRPPPSLFWTLMRAPERLVLEGDRRVLLQLVGGAVLCSALYGASAGFFAGGTTIALSAFKGILILALSAALCAPSLVVFMSLQGAELSSAQFARLLAAFSAMLGLFLLGFIPISWLFSVSSTSLMFVVVLHASIWMVALGFSIRLLMRVLGSQLTATIVGWAMLFCVVSFQVATYVRPVLWRSPGAPLFESGKRFFTEQLSGLSQFDQATPPAPVTPHASPAHP